MKYAQNLFLVTALVALTHCSPEQSETKAASYGPDTQAILKVESTQTEPKATKSLSVPYKDGIAVISDEKACYWIWSDVVFSCNEAAKGWSNTTDFAPRAIDFNNITEAIRSYTATGKFEAAPIASESLFVLDKILRMTSTTRADKKSASMYFGVDDENICEITFTLDHAANTTEFINTKDDNPEFGGICVFKGDDFALSKDQDTSLKLSTQTTKTPGYSHFIIDGKLVHKESGKILTVATKGMIIVDFEKATKVDGKLIF